MTIKIDLRGFITDNICQQNAGLFDRYTSATHGLITGGPAPWSGAIKCEVQYRL